MKGQTGKGKHGLTAVASRREAIAATLAECPVQQWIAADELLRYVCASGNDFAVSRNAWNLYIGELQYGSLGYAGGEGILEKRYLLCLLFEDAATLGLVDVAFIPPAGARGDYHDLWGTDELPYFRRYDGLMFLRVTPRAHGPPGLSWPPRRPRDQEPMVAWRRTTFDCAVFRRSRQPSPSAGWTPCSGARQ